MSRCNVLVVSAEASLAPSIDERLDAARYEVVAVMPGPGLIRLARQAQPHVAVIDGINVRPDAASLEVALLKDQCPDVRIIVMSADSSDVDGRVIEQGVFCYLAGCSVEEVVRVIEAAANGRPWSSSMVPNSFFQPRSVP